MGAREDKLARCFPLAGYAVSSGALPYPSQRAVAQSRYGEEVQRVYEALGGVLNEFPLRLQKWDIEVGGVAVELDEMLHFNRYRLRTLQSSVYHDLPHFPIEEYRTYCDRYERACLSAGSCGGKWSNRSCESQFGPAAPPGSLAGGGLLAGSNGHSTTL